MSKLLIIRFSALGDVAMLVPMIENLANIYPKLSITILSRKQVAPLFADMPDNVHFFGADLRGRHKGIKGMNRLLQDIDYQQFDAVADMHDVLRSKYLRMRFRLIGKRVSVIQKGRISKFLLIKKHNFSISLPSTIERYQDVLQRLGLSIQLHPQQNNGGERIGIGIAPFAAHKGKIYPLEKMEEVVRLLSNDGEPIYLFGAGQQEQTLLEQWAVTYPNVTSLAGKQDMAKEIAIMRGLRLMVTMDSANMHLASIAGTRVLSIWGATHPAAGFLGYGQNGSDCIQRDLPCRPCSVYGNKPCQYGDYHCLDIAPGDIVKRITQALCK